MKTLLIVVGVAAGGVIIYLLVRKPSGPAGGGLFGGASIAASGPAYGAPAAPAGPAGAAYINAIAGGVSTLAKIPWGSIFGGSSGGGGADGAGSWDTGGATFGEGWTPPDTGSIPGPLEAGVDQYEGQVFN